MTAEPDLEPRLDFSDLAILRASLAAIVVGPALMQGLWTIATAVWLSLVSADNSPLLVAITMLPGALLNLVNPAVMLMSFCLMGFVLVVGFFVMAAYKGDHTTWKAAAIIGARTAAIFMAIPLFFAFLIPLGALISGRSGGVDQLLIAVASVTGVAIPIIGIGALTGLAARAAAGSPTLKQEAANQLPSLRAPTS